MSPTAVATLSGLGLATFLSALVSALETALFCLKEHHVAKLAEDRPNLRRQVARIARHTRKSINEVLVLSSISNMSLAILGFFVIREGPALFPDNLWLNAIAVLGIIVLLGDLLPKLFALVLPELVFRVTIRPFVFISPVLEKIAASLAVVAEKIASNLLPISPTPHTNFSDVEVETLVELRRDDGTLLASESEIIQDVIRLGNKTTKDCLTPRTDAFMLSADCTPAEAASQIRDLDSWHWQVPVYEENPDHITGILNVRDWLQNPDAPLEDYTEAPVFVAETMNALKAFQKHLSKPRNLAIVLDEYGGVEGVLTHSDLIEELLVDGAPSRENVEETIVQTRSGSVTVAGDTRLDEINDAIGTDLEFEGLDTIGGLVFTEMGHLPKPGAHIKIDNVHATVKKVEGARITEVELVVESHKR